MDTRTIRERARQRRPVEPDEHVPGTWTSAVGRATRRATAVDDERSARAFLSQLNDLEAIGHHHAAAEFARLYAEEIAEARSILKVT